MENISTNSTNKHTLKDLIKLANLVNFNPFVLIIPTTLALIAALLEGVGFGLLIPTIQSIIEGNTTSINKISYLKKIISTLPNILSKSDTNIFALLIISVFIIMVLKNTLQYISSCGMSFYSLNFSNRLRKYIYEKYLSFGKLFFDENNIGRLQQILTGYTIQISQEFRELNSIIYFIFCLIVYLIVMLLVSWKLTIFVIFSFPLVNFSFHLLSEKIKQSSSAYVNSFSELVKSITNSLTCIPLVKTYANENEEKKYFNKASDQIQSSQFSIDKKYLIIGPAQEIMLLVLVLILVTVIAFLVIRDKTGELAGFMVFFVILKRSFSSIGAVARFNAVISSISGQIAEIVSVLLDKDNKYHVKEGSKEFHGLQKSIRFVNLKFSYPNGVQSLKAINLSIEKGKLTALVGPSGAGKSTIINLIMRLYDCEPKTVFFDETDVREFSLQSLYSKMALVSQDTQLLNASIKENLIYGLNCKIEDHEIKDAIYSAKLDSLVEKLPNGTDTEIGDKGIKLSGGEKQRLSIARAILKQADIIILDEATSSLDSKTEKLIQEAIDKVTSGRTAIVIAHRLSTIQHADKIVTIEDGQIKEEGTLKELLDKKGVFYKLWEEQKFY